MNKVLVFSWASTKLAALIMSFRWELSEGISQISVLKPYDSKAFSRSSTSHATSKSSSSHLRSSTCTFLYREVDFSRFGKARLAALNCQYSVLQLGDEASPFCTHTLKTGSERF